MYKIYINETPLVLAAAFEAPNDKWLVAPYRGKVKFLHHYIDLLEKTDRYEGVALLYPDPDQLFENFSSLYKVIEAAGGVVTNPQHQMLFIYRRGFWDMPKGKLDPGETPEEAAVREVQEETGLQEVNRGDLLEETWHTYKTKKGKRVLKRTYWYLMYTEETELVLQTEEDIEDATWKTIEEFFSLDWTIYRSILGMLMKHRSVLAGLAE